MCWCRIPSDYTLKGVSLHHCMLHSCVSLHHSICTKHHASTWQHTTCTCQHTSNNTQHVHVQTQPHVHVGMTVAGGQFRCHVVVRAQTATHTMLKQTAAPVLFTATMTCKLTPSYTAPSALVKIAAMTHSAALICDKKAPLHSVGTCTCRAAESPTSVARYTEVLQEVYARCRSGCNPIPLDRRAQWRVLGMC